MNAETLDGLYGHETIFGGKTTQLERRAGEERKQQMLTSDLRLRKVPLKSINTQMYLC